MPRSERQAQQRRANQNAGQHARQREQPPRLTDDQQAALDDLLANLPALAQALRKAQPAGREAIAAQLAPIEGQPEAVALTFAARLGTYRGDPAHDAADIAEALGELGTQREVAREARRSRLRLRSAGTPPTLSIPAAAPTSAATVAAAAPATPPAPATPEEAAAEGSALPAPIPLRQRRARLVEAHATRSREGGEVALVLGWQEGIDPDFVHGHLIQLDFWRGGVRDFREMETMRRKRFLSETVERLQSAEGGGTVAVTWAQARRLTLEALAVNAWRGTEPPPQFQEMRPTLDERLLHEPEDEEQREAITRENERVEREGDRFLISTGMEPEELLANWLGAWSFGDYALVYDLLAADNAMRRTQTRNEFITVRRQWASEAKPADLRLTLLREQQKRASALWVPGSAGPALGAGRDFEAFWSLALDESPVGGQLDELPLGTLVSKESGRHWYWTGYTMNRDRASGQWLIARQRDEGAASQALTIEELQARIKEARDAAEQAAQAAPPDPRSREAIETVRQVTGELTAALHYYDALMVKLPLDENIPREALDTARTLNNHERAAALLERMVARYPDRQNLRFEYGVEQYLTAEQYNAQGAGDAAVAWLDRAIATMEQVAEAERTGEHLQGLGELLARRGNLSRAEEVVREGIALDPQRASLHADLASILMSRASDENAEGAAVTDVQREAYSRDALAALSEAARLDHNLQGVFTRMGAIYDMLGQPDDARVAFEEALRVNADDSDARYALGSLLLRHYQDAASALPHLERAAEIDPLAVPYRLALATAYATLGRKQEATRELDLLDRLQPGLPQAAELRTLLNRQK